METRKIRTHIGENGRLQIDIPTDMRHVDLDVIIVYHSIREQVINPDGKTPGELGYSNDFVHNVLGGWQGEPLVRGEQPYYEHRSSSQDREAS